MKSILNELRKSEKSSFILLNTGHEVTGIISSVRDDIIKVKVKSFVWPNGSEVHSAEGSIPIAITEIVTAFSIESKTKKVDGSTASETTEADGATAGVAVTQSSSADCLKQEMKKGSTVGQEEGLHV